MQNRVVTVTLHGNAATPEQLRAFAAASNRVCWGLPACHTSLRRINCTFYEFSYIADKLERF